MNHKQQVRSFKTFKNIFLVFKQILSALNISSFQNSRRNRGHFQKVKKQIIKKVYKTIFLFSDGLSCEFKNLSMRVNESMPCPPQLARKQHI